MEDVDDFRECTLVRVRGPFNEFTGQVTEERYHHSMCCIHKDAHLRIAYNVVPIRKRAACYYCGNIPLIHKIEGSPYFNKHMLPMEFFRENGLKLVGKMIGAPVPYPFY